MRRSDNTSTAQALDEVPAIYVDYYSSTAAEIVQYFQNRPNACVSSCLLHVLAGTWGAVRCCACLCVPLLPSLRVVYDG